MGLSVWQILLIVAVIVLLFGANRIPRLMKDVGSGVTAFRKGLKDDDDKSGDKGEKDEPKPALKADETAAKSEAGEKDTAKKS